MSIEKLIVCFKTKRSSVSHGSGQKKQILIENAQTMFRGKSFILKGSFRSLTELRDAALTQQSVNLLQDYMFSAPLLEFSMRIYANDVLVDTMNLGLELCSFYPSNRATLYEIKKEGVKTLILEDSSLWKLRAKFRNMNQSSAEKKYPNKRIRYSYTKCGKMTLLVYEVGDLSEQLEDQDFEESGFDLFD